MPNLIKQCGDIELNPGPVIKEPQLCHVNLRSLTADGDTSRGTTKFEEFESYVASYNFEIIGISETWLDNSIENKNIALKHYFPPIRRDGNRHGGGICAYIDEDFPAKHASELEQDNIEVLCFEYFIKKRKN